MILIDFAVWLIGDTLSDLGDKLLAWSARNAPCEDETRALLLLEEEHNAYL